MLIVLALIFFSWRHFSHVMIAFIRSSSPRILLPDFIPGRLLDGYRTKVQTRPMQMSSRWRTSGTFIGSLHVSIFFVLITPKTEHVQGKTKVNTKQRTEKKQRQEKATLNILKLETRKRLHKNKKAKQKRTQKTKRWNNQNEGIYISWTRLVIM